MPNKNQYEYEVALAPHQVLDHLTSAADPAVLAFDSSFPYAGKHRIVAKVDGNRFRLWTKRSFGNPCMPVLSGEVQKTSTGSAVTATLRWPQFTRVWVIFWFGLMALLAVAGAVLLLTGKWTLREGGAFELILAGFCGFLAVLVQWCVRLARPDRVDLLELLASVRSAG